MEENLDYLFYPEHHQPVEEQPAYGLYDRWETI